jgi:hypothetical protein
MLSVVLILSVPVCLSVSPHTQQYPVLTSEDGLLQSLGASRLKCHIRRKRVVGAFVLRQKVMEGHVKIILFYFCASHSFLHLCRVILKGSAVFHFSFHPFMFPLTSTYREVCCLLPIDWRVVSRNCSWQKREYVRSFNLFRKMLSE